MIGLFISRVLLMIFGYAYPAYQCFKSVEKKKPEVQQLLFWCKYWIIVAGLTICERVGDTFISWLPFYCEMKLGIFIYLWYSKTKGTAYVFSSFFQPYMAKHETEIDGCLLKLTNELRQVASLYWQRAVFCCYKIFSEFINHGSSQSSVKPEIFSRKKNATEAREEMNSNSI